MLLKVKGEQLSWPSRPRGNGHWLGWVRMGFSATFLSDTLGAVSTSSWSLLPFLYLSLGFCLFLLILILFKGQALGFRSHFAHMCRVANAFEFKTPRWLLAKIGECGKEGPAPYVLELPLGWGRACNHTLARLPPLPWAFSWENLNTCLTNSLLMPLPRNPV